MSTAVKDRDCRFTFTDTVSSVHDRCHTFAICPESRLVMRKHLDPWVATNAVKSAFRLGFND